MSERQYNEEKYNKLKVEGENIKNAAICNDIADESLTWNPSEAVYWRKKAIEIIEGHYGDNNINNTFYYDKIVNDLLEKGSYQQAAKWNNKSKKIKIKEKGKYAIEVIINDLYELDIDVQTKKYDTVVECMEHVKESLQKNAGYDPIALYDIYLKLASKEGDSGIREKWGYSGYFANQAIGLAQEIYGEDSLEVAEAYRRKAFITMHMWRGEKENEESLVLFKKALLIAIEKGASGGNAVKKIFSSIENCWDREVRWQECIKWTSSHISKEFALDIMATHPSYIQDQISETLKTIV